MRASSLIRQAKPLLCIVYPVAIFCNHKLAIFYFRGVKRIDFKVFGDMVAGDANVFGKSVNKRKDKSLFTVIENFIKCGVRTRSRHIGIEFSLDNARKG